MTEPVSATTRADGTGGRLLGYVPALDGVRGVAALAVLAVHYLHPIALGQTPLSFIGGTFGVTMFFVLSGFLISTLLAGEFQRTGRIGLRAFWARRALRLIPALALAIVGVIILGALVDAGLPIQGQGLTQTPPPADGLVFLGFGPGIASTILPVMNWTWVGGYYFKPLAIAWTLAIEDQFYLLWPLVLAALLGLMRLPLRTAAKAAFALTAASMIWRYVLWANGLAGFRTDFFIPDLLLGCAVGLAVAAGMRPPGRWGQRILAVTAMLALVGLLVMIAGVPESTEVRLTSIAGILTAIILVDLVLRQRSLLSSILAWPPLVGIGMVSYGLYLWHWIWKMYPIYNDTWRVPLEVVLTTITVLASFYLVERPALRLKRYFQPGAALPAVARTPVPARPLSRRDLLPVVGMATVVVASAALVVIVPPLFPPDMTALANSEPEPPPAPRAPRPSKTQRRATPRAQRRKKRKATPNPAP
ncbi:MAG: acyltransferase [Thermomicrobiales bacterium]